MQYLPETHVKEERPHNRLERRYMTWYIVSRHTCQLQVENLLDWSSEVMLAKYMDSESVCITYWALKMTKTPPRA